MTISLHDISVKTYIQMLGSCLEVMKQGVDHLGAEKAQAALSYRLIDDMLPMSFQLYSVCHHSLGAIEGMRSGVFGPPADLPEKTFAQHQEHMQTVLAQLEDISESEVNAFEGKLVKFKAGDLELEFTCENFVNSFSVPNLVFHFTTFYDMLRIHGVPLSKRHFVGRARINI